MSSPNFKTNLTAPRFGQRDSTFPETLDVSIYSSGRKQPAKSLSGILPQRKPIALFTTVPGSAPIEFNSSGICHNFNLQLSGALLVNWINAGNGRTRLVAPGHTSLNVAEESFRCVVWPAVESLSLHVLIPPDWISQVREQEIDGGNIRGISLTTSLGKWEPPVRDVALRLTEAARFGQGTSLLTDQLLLALAIQMIRAYDGGRSQTHTAGQMSLGKLRDVIEYLHSHLGNAIALADLARIADLSPFHFARSFKASVGVSPHRYLTEIRLERARLLLATTKRSMTDIALSLGFDTSSHFCNTFRANVGATPSAFRLQNS